MHLSYLRPKLFSYLLAFPQLFSNQWWRVSICWITVLGALIRIWRPEISGGCDISNLLKWREIFSFHTDFHMTCCLLFPPKGNNNNSFVFLYQGANPEVGETVTSPRGLIRCWQRELPGPNRTSARSGLQGGLSHIPVGVQGALAPGGNPAFLAPQEPPLKIPSSALNGTPGISD